MRSTRRKLSQINIFNLFVPSAEFEDLVTNSRACFSLQFLFAARGDHPDKIGFSYMFVFASALA